MKFRDKYNHQGRENRSAEETTETLAEVQLQLQIEISKEHEKEEAGWLDPSVVGDLEIAHVDTASSIGHSIWLSFKRNCYLI